MAEIITGAYLGNLCVQLIHETSGTTITTAAPRDNNGDGSSFSPTDLAAAALGSCMLTVMAIGAKSIGVDLTGMTMRIEKHMAQSPRRIARLPVEIHMPKGISEENRRKLEEIARGCPVHRSLHPDVAAELSFLYDV